MTNEEKAEEIARSNQKFFYEDGGYDIKSSDEECYDSAMEMAEWKDEQFAKEKQALIDNVCEWLKNNIRDYHLPPKNEDDRWSDLLKMTDGLIVCLGA